MARPGHAWSRPRAGKEEEEEEEEEGEDPLDARIARTGCLEQHRELQHCMERHRDWRQCQAQLRAFGACMERREQRE
ncbi:COA4 factor, partial [Sakesphorus luctuosus]|nr:COA4 factor [Sakesphorus luctuosus]